MSERNCLAARPRIPVRPVLSRCGRKAVNHVRRWADLGVTAAEIDQGLAVGPRRLGHAGQERGEVLRRKAVEASRTRSHPAILGGFGGTSLVAGVRWSFRGKDAGSVRISAIRARLRTPPRGEQRGPAAQTVLRQTLLRTALLDLGRPAAVAAGSAVDPVTAGTAGQVVPRRRLSVSKKTLSSPKRVCTAWASWRAAACVSARR